MTRILLIACLALAACGTPQEQCARSVDRDLRTVTSLIDETQANLRRGYRYVYETRNTHVGFRYCSRSSNFGMCFDNSAPSTVRRAVAIDPAQEKRKLASLNSQQARLQSAQCRPDGARILAAPN